MSAGMDRLDLAARALAAGSAADLTAILSSVFAGQPEAASLADWVRFMLSPGAPPPEVSERTIPFLDNIARLRRRREKRAVPDWAPSQSWIGKELDFIGDPELHGYWNPVQYLNYLLMSEVKPTRRAAIVGTMRDDGIYAIEWIAHHLSLGFGHAFIYTNDNADGSELLLRQLASHGVITLIESETAGKVPPETKAFEHLVQLVTEARDFEWLLFVDSDEFLMPARRFQNSIDEMISALARKYPEPTPSAILFNWMWYVSAMVYERRPGLLIERFQHTRPHAATKTLVRLADLVSMQPQHFPVLRAGRTLVDSAFEPFALGRIWDPSREPCYDGGWLAHFWPKSFEEFSLKKARGDTLNLENNAYSRPFELFFQWNGPETPTNHAPPDPEFVARVNAKATQLRALEGVREAETMVNDRFRRLIARYDDVGGLRRIYEQSSRKPGPL